MSFCHKIAHVDREKEREAWRWDSLWEGENSGAEWEPSSDPRTRSRTGRLCKDTYQNSFFFFLNVHPLQPSSFSSKGVISRWPDKHTLIIDKDVPGRIVYNGKRLGNNQQLGSRYASNYACNGIWCNHLKVLIWTLRIGMDRYKDTWLCEKQVTVQKRIEHNYIFITYI